MKRCSLNTFCKKIANTEKSYFLYFDPYCIRSLSLSESNPDTVIDIYINCLYSETRSKVTSKHDFHNLLKLTTK